MDLKKVVLDLRTKHDRLEVKLAKEREDRKAEVAKEREDRKDERDRLEDKLEKQDRLLEETRKGYANLEAELAQAKEELKCQIDATTRVRIHRPLTKILTFFLFSSPLS